MDGWLKTLVAAACLVVIVGGGYFAWSEIQKGKQREHLAERALCTSRVRDIGQLKTRLDDQQVLTRCLMQGLISTDDLEQAKKKALGG